MQSSAFKTFCNKLIEAWKYQYAYQSNSMAAVPMLNSLTDKLCIVDLTAIQARIDGSNKILDKYAKLRIENSDLNTGPIVVKINDSCYFDGVLRNNWKTLAKLKNLTSDIVFKKPDQMQTIIHDFMLIFSDNFKALEDSLKRSSAFNLADFNRNLALNRDRISLSVDLESLIEAQYFSGKENWEIEEVYLNAKPNIGAIVDLIAVKNNLNCDVFITVPRSVSFIHETLSWIVKNKVPCDQLIFTQKNHVARLEVERVLL